MEKLSSLTGIQILDNENVQDFEDRKVGHILQSTKIQNQAIGLTGFDKIEFIHNAFPELNFEEINIQSKILNQDRPTPFYVCSMTAGHKQGLELNLRIAKICEKYGWSMGVGSQRRQLLDKASDSELKQLRKSVPNAFLFGNLGISQLINTSNEEVKRLVDSLEAQAMIIHTNPLQECIQTEGTPNFKGGLNRIENLVKELPVPVLVKETGCGFSQETLARVSELGVSAVEISGLGGTHWGRVEGHRSLPDSIQSQVAQTFSNWGISTVDSLLNAQLMSHQCEIWASGGIRNGLDGAKAIALGATAVGLAQPVLVAALESEEKLENLFKTLEYELKVALFCTGSKDLSELKKKGKWKWKK